MMRMAYRNMIYKIRWLLVAQFLLLVPLTTSKVPAIIAFGDSYSDAGNNNAIPTLLKSNFKPYGRHFPGGHPTGRFCDGRLPPDFISEAFGLKPTIPAYLDPAYTIPDFATGVCFASSGTGYDNATSDVFNVIPMWKELEYYKDYQNKLRAYLGNEKANEILSEALYLLSLGTNDFLINYYIFPTRRSQFTIQEYEDFLVGLSGNFIRDLYNLGARKISLTGVPPLGCLPLERLTNILQHHDCNEKYNNVALEFNGKLTNLVRRLNKELRGITIVFADSYHSIDQMITRPSLYGFEEVGVACCSTGTFEISYLCSEHNPLTCSDANKYVFWDAFHPTEKTNRIVVDHYIDSLLVSFR
ncbi:GDSL esterase/lipase At2g42990-like [Corylus avellana]|uniref:GDSL esterase/lipase At2g42990-like n=1 Tax=Corylus avellana TaxID=13451 RepID=UPI00286D362C|nr:GDSL esterase/lipase At2g42990-like [Corylus avellana]